jgi:hypothetical protein
MTFLLSLHLAPAASSLQFFFGRGHLLSPGLFAHPLVQVPLQMSLPTKIKRRWGGAAMLSLRRKAFSPPDYLLFRVSLVLLVCLGSLAAVTANRALHPGSPRGGSHHPPAGLVRLQAGLPVSASTGGFLVARCSVSPGLWLYQRGVGGFARALCETNAGEGLSSLFVCLLKCLGLP